MMMDGGLAVESIVFGEAIEEEGQLWAYDVYEKRKEYVKKEEKKMQLRKRGRNYRH